MTLFPLFLKLDGRRCLVAGAGSVAAEKIESLLRSGARVVVVAPEAGPAVQRLIESDRIEWLPRRFEPADLSGAYLAIAATSDRRVNRAIFEEASRRLILINTVDDPPLCDFFCAAIVERGDLQVAISTGGKSPALAQRLKREIDARLAPDLGLWLDQLGLARREILRSMPVGEARKSLLHRLAESDVSGARKRLARNGDRKDEGKPARKNTGRLARKAMDRNVRRPDAAKPPATASAADRRRSAGNETGSEPR